jgi:hypothetical protein
MVVQQINAQARLMHHMCLEAAQAGYAPGTIPFKLSRLVRQPASPEEIP